MISTQYSKETCIHTVTHNSVMSFCQRLYHILSVTYIINYLHKLVYVLLQHLSVSVSCSLGTHVVWSVLKIDWLIDWLIDWVIDWLITFDMHHVKWLMLARCDSFISNCCSRHQTMNVQLRLNRSDTKENLSHNHQSHLLIQVMMMMMVMMTMLARAVFGVVFTGSYFAVLVNI